MTSHQKWAVLDLETRCNLPLARELLGLDDSVAPLEVCQRLVEHKHAEKNGFLKLPFHEPVSAAILLAERRGAEPDGPISATRWLCWRAGEAPLEQFVARFFETLAGRVCVGFATTGFDLPLMELWASRLRVPAPSYFTSAASPRADPSLHLDLQHEIAGRAGGAGRFDELCRFHGLPGKPGVSGKDVEGLVAEGRLDEVQAYNVTDVLQAHLLLLHVLLRAGRLTRETAALSARSSIALTRTEISPRFPAGSRALGLLDASLEGCGRAPIADAG